MGTATQVKVPDMGDFKDVEVIEILVAPGGSIESEDPLITLESDKATMEIPAPHAGVVGEIALAVGDRVSEGALILTLEAGPEEDAGAASSTVRSPPHASPSARRRGRELGVDLGGATGTGRKGRILREDVERLAEGGAQKGSQKWEGAATDGSTDGPAMDFARFGPVETRPLPRVQRLSGANLHRTWVNAPHVTQHDLADITDLEDFRHSLQDESPARVTLLAFLLKASAAALNAFPTFNASLAPDGGSLIIKQYCHIGVAVDTPAGLVVPVIRDVDRKGILELADDLAAMGAKAREKRITPSDLQGGCFTVSSLGGIGGGTGFTPILNAPEVAILGVARSSMQPVYRDGQFQPRRMLPLSLSYDHRVIDGANGARFAAFLCSLLADIRRLLL